MNVIVANKRQSMLQELEIDVIKTLEGEFDVDDLIAQFQNFFFQRMILDITALKNYKDVKTLQKLSITLDMDKVILLLDDSDESGSNEYLSKLISMGIYNFTKNIEGIMYLYNNPNTYRDVAHIHQLDASKTQEVVVEKYQEVEPVQGTKIIGVKNITKQSGATTLIYMMVKQLEKNYSVIALEVNKSDFRYFNDKKLVSIPSTDIGNAIASYSDHNVILIDINDSNEAERLCHEVLYLVEPSIIKLNKLMLVNSNAFKELKNKKIILNQSLLNAKDVLDFEYESGSKIYYNMPPLDEREKSIHVLNTLLVRLGFTRQKTNEQEKKNNVLGLFGK